MLINDIATGTIDPSIDLPEDVRESILRKIQPMPERAAELEEIFKNGADHCFVPQIWPKLIYMYGVGGDGFSIYDKTMKERFTNNCVKNIYAGVNASEGIWSIPVKLDMEDGALAPRKRIYGVPARGCGWRCFQNCYHGQTGSRTNL